MHQQEPETQATVARPKPSPGMLPGSGYLGFGFNVLLGKYSTESCTQLILPPLEAGPQTFSSGGQTYTVPQGVVVASGSGGTMTAAQAQVFESQRQVQDSFAAKAKVSGTYGGFSGEVEALYGSESTREESAWYALVEGRQESFRMAVADLTPSQHFCADQDVKALTSLGNPVFDPSNPEVFFRVFRKWGTHIVAQIAMGGRVDYAATVSRSAASDSKTIGAKFSLEYQAVFGTAGAQAQADWKKLTASWANSREVKISGIGGSDALLALAAPSFGDNYSVTFSEWLLTLEAQPAIIDLNLQPLSQLSLFSGKVVGAIDDAIAAYLDNGIYVEAALTPQGSSALIDVSGKAMDTSDPFAGGRNRVPDGGAQLVVVDASSLKPVINNTLWYYRRVPYSWDTLFKGTDALPASYFCALRAVDWPAGESPAGKGATWLKSCGASLAAWQKLGSASKTVAYAFIGKNNWMPGQGHEQLDWDRGKHTAFASAITPLVPRAGGGFSLPR